MSKIQFPRMEVLQSLSELTADITPNRFISSRPNASGEQMREFLLIRLPQGVYDRGDTYQTSRGQFVVFVRDVQYGIENSLRLEQLQQQIVSLFPIVTDRFHAKSPRLLSGGSDGAGFHSLIIQFNITILKQLKS